MEEATDVKLDIPEEDPIPFGTEKAPKTNTRNKMWRLATGTVFFAAVAGTALFLTTVKNPAAGDAWGTSNPKLGNDGGDQEGNGARTTTKASKRSQHVLAKQQSSVTYIIDYVMEWNATGTDCGVPFASLGAMCGQGATMSLPEHDRNLHACKRDSMGTVSCSDTSSGVIVIRCESNDKQTLALSAHWYGDQVECAANGTATQTIRLAALTPASSNPEDDIPVDGKLCLGIMDPSINQPITQPNQYTCESGIRCPSEGNCGIAGVMLSTLDISTLEERGCIYVSPCSDDPCEQGFECIETTGSGAGYVCAERKTVVCDPNPCPRGHDCIESSNGGFSCVQRESSAPRTTPRPTTPNPVTPEPTTARPTTASPTTETPTSASPTTGSPLTSSPTTASSSTLTPTATSSPTTTTSTTASPITSGPNTLGPTTSSPTTSQSSTPTGSPSTSPATASTTTLLPTTASPTATIPSTTASPTTIAPSTVGPSTARPTTASPTSPAPAVPPHTTYLVNWFSRGGGGMMMFDPPYYGCEDPQPEMTATCGGGGIIRIIDFEGDNHDCKLTGAGSVQCGAHQKGVTGHILLLCETDNDSEEDLILTVTLPGETLFCNGVLDGAFAGYYGGTALNHLSVLTYCNDVLVSMEEDTCSGDPGTLDNGNLYCANSEGCLSDPMWHPYDCEAVLEDTAITTSGPLIEGSGCIYGGE